MSAHTPGPWVAEMDDYDEPPRPTGWITNATGDQAVVDYAGCGSHHAKWNDADLRLALASPDLLEALKMFVWPYQEQCKLTEAERMQQARAAIAKATGETHGQT